MAPTETKAEAPKSGPPKLSDVKELIDESTFEQILEMDDDDDRDFSKGIVYGFFDQAHNTFEKMETALEGKQLEELSQLGHFLKGSSATLGLTNVKDACEKIQHYGAGKDESGSIDEPDDEVSLKKIGTTLKEVNVEYAKVEKFLRRYYGEEVKEEEPKKEEPMAEPKEKSKEEPKKESSQKEEPKPKEEKEKKEEPTKK
jgi:osomolarity two-component system phosphorelay intermediate protein YPD1